VNSALIGLAVWIGLDVLFVLWLLVLHKIGRRRRTRAMYGKAPANVRALRGHETRRG
jgi:hypothetical protein